MSLDADRSPDQLRVPSRSRPPARGLERHLDSGDRVKRLFDVVVAGSGLIILAPLVVALAMLVRLRLGRPVIFSQQRPGLRGKPFTIYKFRTMLDTRDSNGELLPSAQRMHPFGQRLRALSLDELPELWNVIKGDMSIVGPRPLMTQYLPRYNAEQARRHQVRPGITGLGQVAGRNALTWEQKFALDVDYVDNRSLRMDIAIILRTFRTVVSREGIVPPGQVEMPEFLGSGGPDAASDGRA